MPEKRKGKSIKEGGKDCIWSKAGVSKKRSCQKDYECASCKYDQIMQRVAEENSRLRRQGKKLTGRKAGIVAWQTKVREMPPWRRPCVHHLKGRIDFRSCSNDYNCINCEFDQYFMDELGVRAIVKPVDVMVIKGISIPQGYYLHEGHGWAKIEEGNIVRIGIDDFAGRLFGSFTEVETPLIGKAIKQGVASVTLKNGANEAKMIAPVSGVVMSINGRLLEDSSCISSSPYEEGWFLTVHAASLRDELRKLMIGTEAMSFVEKEVETLHQAIEESGGPLGTDGGFIATGLLATMPELDWYKMRRKFLRT